MKAYTLIQRTLFAITLLAPPAIANAGTLADSPLSLKGAVPPNVLFAISVEFPTANTAAYQGANDYSPNNEYLGYFDPKKCYQYDAVNERFNPATAASTDTDPAIAHTCGATGYWSGNLLNWATMTGLDEFRYAMTGGHRSTDTSTTTVIERTYQSGQGGTSNFPDKTFVDTDGTSTPFAAGTSLNIQNQGRGIKMLVTPSASTDVGTCANPTIGGGFNCSGGITTPSTGTGACTAVTGSGTSASPYRCTAMSGGFSAGVPSNIAAVSPPTVGGASSAADNVICSNPKYDGISPFECNGGIALQSNGSTATCNTWTGDGSAGAPFTCTSFSTFSGNETFSVTGSPTISSFSSTSYGPTETMSSVTCTPSGSSPVTMTCSSGGHTATCNTYTGNGTGTPYKCVSFGFNNGEVYVSRSNKTHTTTYNSKTYYDRYTIDYKPVVTQTYYYASSYPGATGTGFYYTSTYNLTWGSAQTYYVRVKVCDAIGYEDNCVVYGSSHKPTGVIQDNGDKMRFGVFSYYGANDIDNAVMRSKLKEVAPLKYSPSGTPASNPLKEWSAADGTLIQNPDASDPNTATSYVGATTNSGVINYINKFGRTSQSYKTYDNIGKLYYEAQKYLRGLQATPDLYQGARASNADGFPVITTWDDPIQYSCQKSYILTMGDTHTHCDKRLPGGSIGSYGSSQCKNYTDANGNAHPSDSGGTLGSDTAINVTTETDAIGTLEGIANLSTSTYSGSASYYMAGLAKWGASNDTRTDIVGKQTITSVIIDVEEYKDCGYNSQFWMTAKYGNPPSYDLSTGNWIASQTPDQSWAQSLTLSPGVCASRAPPGYSSASGGNVTWPKNLLRAGDPLSMITSVRNAISTIAAQVGQESALAQSSGSINTGTGVYLYRATYNSAGWTGDVAAFVVDQNADINQTPAWKASAKLPAAASRNIVTFNDGQAADRTNESTSYSRRGVAFNTANFATQLSSFQQAALNMNYQGVTDGYGADRVAFLRGQRDGEAFLPGTTTTNPSTNNRGFRSRVDVLGDFLNSTPRFVAAPNSPISGSTYLAFASAHASRRKMIYVGGNDGMLHAFDASYTINATTGLPETTISSGSEVFAYVPSAVYSRLSNLTASNYAHKFYVDGSPVTADACFNSCTFSTDWKTMLVGGLNAGGQGIYALDVTDPDSFSASSVLWEFNDQDDPDLGYTFGRPLVAKLNNGKWAVIFGNGYNNTVADGKASTTGRAALFIVYVDGPGAGNAWTAGTNYIKIPLKSPDEGGTLPNNPANGLGSVTSVDKNLDGKADYVYATDRRGNLWKIDLTSSNPTNWAAAFGTTADPLPLFTATTGGGAAQQFTTGLSAVRHPYGGFMVLTGTGSWIDTTDVSATNSDTLYGVWDKDDGATRVTRADLQKQRALLYVNYSGTDGVTVDGEACTVGSPGCTKCTATLYGCAIVPSTCLPHYGAGATTASNVSASCPSDIAYPTGTGTQLGWAYDLLPLASSPPALPASQLGSSLGERTFSDKPSIAGSAVRFESLTPATDPCTGNTSGTSYTLSWLTGGAVSTGVLLFTTNGTGKVSLSGNSYAGQGNGSQNLVLGGSAQKTGAIKDLKTITAPPKFCSSLPPGVPGGPPAPCTGTNCPGYVPGWGFLDNLAGAKSQPTICECSTGTADKCIPMLKPAEIGRLTWKKITR